MPRSALARLRARARVLALALAPLALAVPALGLLGVPSPAPPQSLPSPLPPTNPAPIVYCPPERLAAGPAAPQHVLNVFLPRGSVPAAGWPVVVATGYGGGASVPAVSRLDAGGPSAPLWNLVAAGIAVVHFGTPGLSPRGGLWYPPGHPSGRWESFLPRDDNPEKSAVWAVQWVKTQTRYPFDVERVGMRGSSGGAALAIRTAMGPERARDSGSPQVRASTRVAAVLAIQPPTSAWALEQGDELTIAFPRHLEQAARPGVPATQLSQVAPELQKDYSLMREAFATASARANNERQPVCIVYGDPVLRVGGSVATFDLDSTGFPLLHDAIRQPLQHDSWFGYVFWRRLVGLSSESAAFHARHSMFAMRDVYALGAPYAWHTATYSGSVLGSRASRLGHDWLVGRLLGPTLPRAAEPPPPAPPSDLVRLADDGARVALGLRGAPGATAIVVVTGAALTETSVVETSAGRLEVDLRALAALPRVVRLAPGPDGLTRVELELGADERGPLYAQALRLEKMRGGRVRATLSDSLEIELEVPVDSDR